MFKLLQFDNLLRDNLEFYFFLVQPAIPYGCHCIIQPCSMDVTSAHKKKHDVTSQNCCSFRSAAPKSLLRRCESDHEDYFLTAAVCVCVC